MKNLLKDVTSDHLRVYFVWIPILGHDSRGWAEKRTLEVQDDRVSHFWDGNHVVGKSWIPTLTLPGPAWDVYFLYNPQSVWDKIPSQPAFLMHQLANLPPELHLSKAKAKFKQRVIDLLNLEKQK